jgi:hypothetical protein
MKADFHKNRNNRISLTNYTIPSTGRSGYIPSTTIDTAPIFCGQNSIDTQYPSSYTPGVKKEYGVYPLTMPFNDLPNGNPETGKTLVL